MTASDFPKRSRKRFATLTSLVACAAIAVVPATASAGGGGVGTGDDSNQTTVAGDTAKLKNGKAIPPESAPARVKRAIRAANDIRNKPYRMGGGHGKWKDSGYDCSGAVSYALGKPGARLVKSPMPSGSYMNWKKRGKGKWITVYANEGHMYAVIAGLRWDTSQTKGDGPGWSRNLRAGKANGPFEVRHHPKF
ncbi:hypothetical protein HJD18_14660 [Thermoleophilia bacterium SCSIO 60948]|nr:hypothetical protein HJD18_14660 [Thermoleophilia bacterium SCSIO 60948]